MSLKEESIVNMIFRCFLFFVVISVVNLLLVELLKL